MGLFQWLRPSNKDPANKTPLDLTAQSVSSVGVKTEELFTGLREEEKALFRSEERNGYLLTIEEGHPKNKSIVLIGMDIEVGRSPVSEVTLDDGMVSEKHFKLKIVRGKTPILEDMGSTNGTKVNGLKVRKAELKDGDQIQVGLTKLIFHLDSRKI